METEGIRSSKRPRCDKDLPEADVKGAGGVLPWENASSRIIRVSRVSGGKDRHSKVLTVKGLRDRRVRLSVSTSIQFYDLQDRLGYDQPSKAVDWLIKAAAAAIVDLPELEGPFPVLPSLALPGRAILSKRPAAGEQRLSQSTSTCEKDHKNVNKESSFSELITAGDNCNGGVAEAAVANFSCSSDPKQLRPLPAGSTSNYFRQAGIFGHSPIIPQLEPSYYSLLHHGSNPNMGMGTMTYNAIASGEHQDIHQFSFMHDHANPVNAAAPGGDANHNVSISSGFAGLSRGTLQSNSSLQHHLVHGTNLPFFLSATLPITTVAGTSSENQFPGDFNGRLQLFCNDARSLPGLKRERKG